MNGIPQNHQLLKQVLNDYKHGPGQVVRANTTTDRIRDQRSLDSSRMYFRKYFRALDHEVIENFLELKMTAAPVAEIYGEFSDFILLTELELRAIFSIGRGRDGSKDGWQQFRELHPQSKGTLEVSRPAYSVDGTQCLLEIGQQFDWLAGSGTALHYAFKDGAWISMASARTWIS